MTMALVALAMLLLNTQVASFLIQQNPSPSSLKLNQIKILYESERILAIEKPQNISHHDDSSELGILSIIRQQQSNGEINYQGRLYGVHRLDRVTSGALLLAKDSKTAGLLSKKFRDGEVTKFYCGISAKKPRSKKQGWVKGNMVKSRRKSWMLTRTKASDADNYAVSRFWTAGLSLLAKDVMEPTIVPKTLLLFRPHTGKTHQLRVAAKSVGLPLLGDDIYSDGLSISAPRTYLHSCALQVQLDHDENVIVWSPPPFSESLWLGDAREKFSQLVKQIMAKHCDCVEVCEMID